MGRTARDIWLKGRLEDERLIEAIFGPTDQTPAAVPAQSRIVFDLGTIGQEPSLVSINRVRYSPMGQPIDDATVGKVIRWTMISKLA